MPEFIIQGGRPISGTHKVGGNKNAALPMLAAALLTDRPLVLKNLPLIEDVLTMLALLDKLGVSVTLKGDRVTLNASGLRRSRLDPDLCRKVRSSILFAGPLVARLGRATLFPPGGDVIGRRRLDTHFEGLTALGTEIKVENRQGFVLKRKTLLGTNILLDEASVTATENILMAATLAEGRTTLFNTACEPHVQALCRMLNSMGAKIEGIGTNRLIVEGVEKLQGTEYAIPPDYIEAGSMIAASAMTGGDLTLENIHHDDLATIVRPFRKLGVHWKLDSERLFLPAKLKLAVEDDFGGAIPKIEDGIWPGVPSDLMSVLIVLATKAEGTLLFFEKLFESRMFFVDKLIAMGARIIQCDPHRVVVSGPSRLHGTVMSSPDIRAGMSLLLAALSAKGESRIGNAPCIDRGYENIEKKLRVLGADIERI